MSSFGPFLLGTWRGSPFIRGQRYRVVTPGQSYVGTLTVGEILEYLGATYIPYDGVSSYVFVTDRGEKRHWALRDDEPLELWSSVFETAGNAG